MEKEIIPFQTYLEQITKIRNKNIEILESNEDKVISKLKNHSYYSLINGYKPIFLKHDEKDVMLDNTRFEHLYACKILEMDLSTILLKYIMVVEQGFRTRVAYVIAREFGTDDTIYTLESNYTNSAGKRNQAIKALLEVVNNPNKNSYSYYFKNVRIPNASIPPWIAIQDMEFHKVIFLYQSLPEHLRNEIRRDYLNIHTPTPKENILFINSMHFIREYRNIFAHSKRNFQEKISHDVDKKIFNNSICHPIENTIKFNENNKVKNLHACILLTFSYLQDSFLETRLTGDLLTLFLSNDYVKNIKFTGNDIFNGKNIYNILELPETILHDLLNLTSIPIDEVNDYYSIFNITETL